ncbi:MAG: nickel-dependent hydrogenase large subunit [Sulfolobales archaeon]|nr:nickel-dependent hydrogenase large subunit [Sulfolobales archaeon]
MALIEIPVGPQHPALHEPIMLRVRADGEKVVDVQVVTGYNHRGAEKLGERNTWNKNVFLYSRICGICNTVHAQTYTQGVEAIGGIEVPPRAQFLRTLIMELERIHSHILIAAVMAEVVGFESLFMLMMRDREPVMMLKELVTGNRVLSDYYTLGGVRRDIDEVRKDKILKVLERVEERVKYYKKVFTEDFTLNKRLVGVGIIKAADAVKYSLVGPTLRGSGVKSDVRSDDPYAAYGEVPFKVITYDGGDCLSRMLVRFDETLQSIEIVRYVLTHLPQGPIAPKTPIRMLPAGEAFSRVEAPRGELIYHIVSKGGDKPYRVKVRTPSFHNIINGLIAYKEAKIADVPVILTSFDPCISCTERVLIIDEKSGNSRYIRLKDLGRGV